MTSKTIALVMAFVLSSTMALAQSSQGKAGSDNGPTSNAPTTSGNMNQDTTVRVAKKSKTTKMQKSHNRKLQRRQHSGRRYGWCRAEEGRCHHARRHHEAVMI